MKEESEMSNGEKVIGIVVIIGVMIVFLAAIIMMALILTKIRDKRVNPFKKFNRNKSGEILSNEKLRAISVGAILAEVNSDYCDSLKTTSVSAVKTIAGILKRDWGISSASEAAMVLEHLKTLQSSSYIGLILKHAPECILAQEIKSIGQILELADIEILDENKLVRYANNLKEVIGMLKKQGFVSDISELVHMKAEAWDMGRMVNVARYCYDCGYLTEEQAWNYIFYAYEKSAACYQDWSEFAKAYVIVRAIWGGENLNLTVAMDTALELQKNPESPWMAVSLH